MHNRAVGGAWRDTTRRRVLHDLLGACRAAYDHG